MRPLPHCLDGPEQQLRPDALVAQVRSDVELFELRQEPVVVGRRPQGEKGESHWFWGVLG